MLHGWAVSPTTFAVYGLLILSPKFLLQLWCYGVDKSILTNLPGWGEGEAVTSVGWQITLCDLIDKWCPIVLR